MKSTARRVLFIINRYSGAVHRPRVEEGILDICRDQEDEYSLEFTKGPGHATELSKKAAEEFDLIVAVGGDGTVNEVARGLIHSSAHLGIIPTGSGNGLARHLGIPLNSSKAAQTLFNSQSVKMDTFIINKKLSLNVSGIGFDGHIANTFGKTGKRGFIGYSKLAFQEYIQFEKFESVIQTGEKEHIHEKTFIIAIANSSQYGNNARIAPKASVCDKKLHISILKKIPPYRLDFIYALFNGTIDHSHYCTTLESDSIDIHLAKSAEYHVDGEPCGRDNTFSIRLQPASLNILMPHIPNRIV